MNEKCSPLAIHDWTGDEPPLTDDELNAPRNFITTTKEERDAYLKSLQEKREAAKAYLASLPPGQVFNAETYLESLPEDNRFAAELAERLKPFKLTPQMHLNSIQMLLGSCI